MKQVYINISLIENRETITHDVLRITLVSNLVPHPINGTINKNSRK